MRQIVTKLPAILFIQVQKTVNPRANDGFFTVEGVRFEIVGVVDHLGVNTHTGHYITWAKVQSQWFKCDDKSVVLDHGDKHFSVNNYIFVGIRKDETDDDSDRCIPCGKSFSSHLKHLQQAKICQKFYDLEAMKKEIAEKRKILKSQRMRKTRANQTPENKNKALNDNKLCQQKSRANQTPEKKHKILNDDRLSHQKSRANQTPAKKQKVLDDDRLRHQKSQANQTQAKKQKIQDDNKVRLGYDDFC